MSRRALFRSALLAVALLAPAAPANAESGDIAAGYDLLDTADGTSLGLRFSDLGLAAPVGGADVVTFTGVPLGRHSFGDAKQVATGDTDTIVQRTASGSVGKQIPLRVVALQLVSTNTPVPFYVTLDPQRPSTGSILPTAAGPEGGRFTADLDVNYLVRLGSLDGPVVLTHTASFVSESDFGRVNDVKREVQKIAMAHQHRVRPANVEIVGVNAALNGFDRSNDFVPGNVVAAS